MRVIGEKIADYTGKVTTTTVTEAGVVLNVEADVGPFGTVLYTMCSPTRSVRWAKSCGGTTCWMSRSRAWGCTNDEHREQTHPL